MSTNSLVIAAIRSIVHQDLSKMSAKKQGKFMRDVCAEAGISPRHILDHIRALRARQPEPSILKSRPKALDQVVKLQIALTKATKLYRLAIA